MHQNFNVRTSEIDNDSFAINLIPIPMREISVIIFMDYLNEFEALVNCREKIVGVWTPSGGELAMRGNSSTGKFDFCTTTKARKCLQHGCERFLAYVIDT